MKPPTRWPRGWVCDGVNDEKAGAKAGTRGEILAGRAACGGGCTQQSGDLWRPLFKAPAAAGPAGAALTTILLYVSPVEMPRAAPAPAAPAATAASPAPASYEEALAELDRLVQAMEGGQMPLDSLLESYQRGAVLLAFCRERLQAVEAQVKVLEEGQLKPWTNS